VTCVCVCVATEGPFCVSRQRTSHIAPHSAIPRTNPSIISSLPRDCWTWNIRRSKTDDRNSAEQTVAGRRRLVYGDDDHHYYSYYLRNHIFACNKIDLIDEFFELNLYFFFHSTYIIYTLRLLTVINCFANIYTYTLIIYRYSILYYSSWIFNLFSDIV
jgi:hypothetical protein